MSVLPENYKIFVAVGAKCISRVSQAWTLVPFNAHMKSYLSVAKILIAWPSLLILQTLFQSVLLHAVTNPATANKISSSNSFSEGL